MHPHYIVPIFSLQWFSGIILVFIFYSLMIWIGNKSAKIQSEKKFRYFLAAVFIIREVFLYAYIIHEGQFTIQDSLPLHLCNISYLFVIWLFLDPRYFLFEFLIMLGLGGALQSFLTPELTHGYSLYFIIDYYFSHGTIIFGPVYAILVLKMKPRPGSWKTILIFANLLLISIFIINCLLDSNYVYLMKAPAANNPLVLGGYPYHLIGFEIFGTLHVLLLYWLTSKIQFKSTSNNINTNA
jgi:hypothetical integral membrane protein (TIGR02206 family)